MRKGLISAVCLHALLLLASVSALFSTSYVCYAGDVIQVPQDYPTIQQAIDAAIAGDTVQVNRRSGETQSVYYERLTVDKQLVLAGESRETIIIDGDEGGSVIRIKADYVQVRNLTIRNAGQYSGIRSNGYYYVTVANNTLSGNKYGIFLLNSDYHTVVKNLLFSNSVAGISLSESVGNNVSDNEVSDSTYGVKLSFVSATFVVGNAVSEGSYGIYLQSSSNDTVEGNALMANGVSGVLSYLCSDIIVSNNNVTESAYAIELHTSDTITVLGNNATNNSYGIYLAHSTPSNTIENNTISAGDWGIKLYNSSSNTLIGNTLSCNTFGVDPEAESNNNLLYHNNFIDNAEQVVWNPDCVNTWDDGYPSGGNYWSDYTGTDSNGDGIGDTAYNIDPMNKDRYPLMAPWGLEVDVAIISVTSSPTEVYAGEMVEITVVAENQGTIKATFNVTASYENTTLGILGTIGTPQEVTKLALGQNVTLTFSWNTTDVQPCANYTIKAEATVIPGENDTADNIHIDGAVNVRLPGDLNEDGVVDVEDLVIVALAWGSYPVHERWNAEADLNGDSFIDVEDLMVVGRNVGMTCG